MNNQTFDAANPVVNGDTTPELDGGDGQVKTPAQLADTPNLFILDKNQSGFISGKSSHPSRTRLYVSIPFLILWTIGALVAFVALIPNIGTNPINIVFLIIAGLGELVAISFFRTSFRNQRLFELQGKLLQGQVFSSSGSMVRHSGTDSRGRNRSSLSFDVIIRYVFRTPNGQTVNGTMTRTRSDLKNVPLPEPGTPVAVLYVDDKNYLLL